VIDAVPTIVACQTRQVSPLYHRFKNLSYTPPENITSIADALVSVNPPLLELMVEELKAVKGEVEVVDEGETRKSFVELAEKGFFVEPSSAVAYAAYKKHLVNREITSREKTLIVLTGSGLKTAVQQN